jgi:hypothetical protein
MAEGVGGPKKSLAVYSVVGSSTDEVKIWRLIQACVQVRAWSRAEGGAAPVPPSQDWPPWGRASQVYDPNQLDFYFTYYSDDDIL